jgi:hypothetical protein
MKTPAPEPFRSGRRFAAWIGPTPKDYSTAGKVRLGVLEEVLEQEAAGLRLEAHLRNEESEGVNRAVRLSTGKAPRHRFRIPRRLSFWGNYSYGACVSAEEAFAKACHEREIFIPEQEVIDWGTTNGFLNGAYLIDVVDAMEGSGSYSMIALMTTVPSLRSIGRMPRYCRMQYQLDRSNLGSRQINLTPSGGRTVTTRSRAAYPPPLVSHQRHGIAVRAVVSAGASQASISCHRDLPSANRHPRDPRELDRTGSATA